MNWIYKIYNWSRCTEERVRPKHDTVTWMLVIAVVFLQCIVAIISFSISDSRFHLTPLTPHFLFHTFFLLMKNKKSFYLHNALMAILRNLTQVKYGLLILNIPNIKSVVFLNEEFHERSLVGSFNLESYNKINFSVCMLFKLCCFS